MGVSRRKVYKKDKDVPKRKLYSEEAKSRALGLLTEQRFTYREIARETRIPKSTLWELVHPRVQRHKRVLRENGEISLRNWIVKHQVRFIHFAILFCRRMIGMLDRADNKKYKNRIPSHSVAIRFMELYDLKSSRASIYPAKEVSHELVEEYFTILRQTVEESQAIVILDRDLLANEFRLVNSPEECTGVKEVKIFVGNFDEFGFSKV